LKVRVFLLFAISIPISIAAPPAIQPQAIVEEYCLASQQQERATAGATMDVEIDASLPRLKKFGKLLALRRISSIGRVTYEKLFFEGDASVKNNVIARYLTAEAEAQKSESPSLAVTPANYRFKFKGRATLNGRGAYVFELSPREKRAGLYKGEIWIDSETHLRVLESGSFVKTPSVFLKKVAFVRRYDIRDGISVPRQVDSVVETRLVGKAELSIAFSNYSLEGSRSDVAALDGGQ
jgi:hypothetical protein